MVLDTASGDLERIRIPALARPPWEGVYATLVNETEFALGTFGIRALGDVEAASLSVVLPVEAYAWSSDRLYAGMGQVPGHGGLC
jgi:hypothetical protein